MTNTEIDLRNHIASELYCNMAEPMRSEGGYAAMAKESYVMADAFIAEMRNQMAKIHMAPEMPDSFEPVDFKQNVIASYELGVDPVSDQSTNYSNVDGLRGFDYQNS